MSRSVPHLRPRSRTFAVAILVGAALSGGVAAADDPEVLTGPADHLPARPAEVEPAEDATQGEVAFDRQVTWLDLGEGESGQPEIILVNGSDATLSLALVVRPVAADPSGAPLPLPAEGDAEGEPTGGADGSGGEPDRDLEPLPSAVEGITLAEDTVHLDPSEQVRLRPGVGPPDGADSGSYLAALEARGTGSDPPVAVSTFLVVNVGEDVATTAPVVGLDVEQEGRTAIVAVQLRSGAGLDAVDGQVRIRGWWGATEVEADLPPTLILPETRREIALETSTPWAPGRHRVEVAVTSRSGETVTASRSAWLWRPEGALIAVALLTLMTVAALRRAARGDLADEVDHRGRPGGGG